MTRRSTSLWQSLAVRALHRLPAERAHGVAIWALGRGWVPAAAVTTRPSLAATLLGHELPNPLGLAAGFDKDAEALPGLARLGFGFLEVGTVTPRPQAGNPRPRLFRLRQQRALINRMGFNNRGLEAMQARLMGRDPAWGMIGANIGANRDSADPVEDYLTCLRGLHGLVDYLVVNVSSPNTPGLRQLQDRGPLTRLLGALLAARAELAAEVETSNARSQRSEASQAAATTGARPTAWPTPLLLKIAPDLAVEDEAAIAEVALEVGIDGLIIANTTIDRPDVVPARWRDEAGGLSGTPLFLRSTAQLVRFHRLTGGRLPLIGVGGITTGADAYAKIRAGASALQLYTALVYQGPAVVQHLLERLAHLLEEDGVRHFRDAIGVDAGR